jgi:hypothetical protein
VSAALLLVLLAAGATAIGLARLLPHPTAVRLLDIVGTVLAGVALIGTIVALTAA